MDKLTTNYSLHSIAYSLHTTNYSLHSIAYSLHTTTYSLFGVLLFNLS